MEKETNSENESMAKAKQEIEDILVKYNVILVPVVMHQGDKTISRIDIAPASKRSELQ
jgi:DNA-binding protein YbaB